MIDVFWALGCIIFGVIIGLLLPGLIRRLQKPVVLRTIPKEEAKKMILDYFEKYEEKWTSDVIFDLGLSPDLVLDVLKELRQEGKIEARSDSVLSER